MLKSNEVALITNSLDNSIAELIKYDERLPPTNSSQERAAGELWLASRAKKKIDAVFKARVANALKEGVHIDKVGSGIEPGTSNLAIWTGSHFFAVVTVKQPVMRFDKKAAQEKMVELKIPARKIAEIMEAGNKEDNPAHVFDVLPIPHKNGKEGN